MNFKETVHDMLNFIPAFSVFLLVILFCVILNDYVDSIPTKKQPSRFEDVPADISICTIEGHKYIVVIGKRDRQTKAIVHAESCQCKQPISSSKESE